MIRKLSLTILASLVVFAVGASAHEMNSMSSMHKGMAMGKPTTLSGEVVDTGCYLAHEAKGEKHVECASKCINNGMPMGILTSKGSLYLVTLNHDNADPYNKLKTMAGQKVTVVGTVSERSGMKGIDVTEIKTATASK